MDEATANPAGGGDGLAVESLLARHLPGLRAYVRRRAGALVRAHESSADVVQSTCRELLEQIDRFRFAGERGFKQWLYTTALRKLVERDRYYRAQRRRRGAGEPGDGPARSFVTPSRDAMAREEIERVEGAFEQLSPDERDVIVLHKVLGFSYAEIAERHGCAADACKARLGRAMALLVLHAGTPERDET